MASVSDKRRPLPVVRQVEADGGILWVDVAPGEGRGNSRIIGGHAFAAGKAFAVFADEITPSVTDREALLAGEIAVAAAAS